MLKMILKAHIYQPSMLIVSTCGLAIAGFTACSNAQESGEPRTSQQGDIKMLFDRVMIRTFPGPRCDVFYKTVQKAPAQAIASEKQQERRQRFVSNGRGFVAFCPNVETFADGYYLYNFYGKTSYEVDLNDRQYRPVGSSEFDEVLIAYQDYDQTHGKTEARSLGDKQIGDYKCTGQIVERPGYTREDWFDLGSRLLIKQTLTKNNVTTERNLTKVNPQMDTMLLRIPTGFALIEEPGQMPGPSPETDKKAPGDGNI